MPAAMPTQPASALLSKAMPSVFHTASHISLLSQLADIQGGRPHNEPELPCLSGKAFSFKTCAYHQGSCLPAVAQAEPSCHVCFQATEPGSQATPSLIMLLFSSLTPISFSCQAWPVCLCLSLPYFITSQPRVMWGTEVASPFPMLASQSLLPFTQACFPCSFLPSYSKHTKSSHPLRLSCPLDAWAIYIIPLLSSHNALPPDIRCPIMS